MFRLKAPTKRPITTAAAASRPRNRAASTRPDPDMDPGIWAGLPDHLLDYILSFLPFHTLVALRSTSKHVRSLLLCPTFLSTHSFCLPSFLLLSHPQSYLSFPLFDTNFHSWRTLPLPSSRPLTCAPSSDPSSLLSSSRGLLCFSLPGSSSSLSVCNLLTRSSRVVKFPFYPFPFELLTLVASPFGYRIFTLCSSSSSGACSCVYVYNSGDRSWRKFDGFDQVLARGFQQEGVFYKGSLCFAKTEPFMLVSFNLDTGKWTTSAGNGALPTDELTFARLVSDPEKGILYMVGGIGSNGISRGIKIWEFREEMNLWTEMETLPEMICRKFTSVCYHNYEHVYCLWHKGMVCVYCYNWPEILYFDVGRRTWHWLPKCPSLPSKWSCGFRWFSFLPSLSASA